MESVCLFVTSLARDALLSLVSLISLSSGAAAQPPIDIIERQLTSIADTDNLRFISSPFLETTFLEKPRNYYCTPISCKINQKQPKACSSRQYMVVIFIDSIGERQMKKSNKTSYIGSMIKRRRRELKISQEKLGETVGVTYQQIQKYENGLNRVSAEMLHKIASALDTDVSYFYEKPVATDEARERDAADGNLKGLSLWRIRCFWQSSSAPLSAQLCDLHPAGCPERHPLLQPLGPFPLQSYRSCSWGLSCCQQNKGLCLSTA